MKTTKEERKNFVKNVGVNSDQVKDLIDDVNELEDKLYIAKKDLKCIALKHTVLTGSVVGDKKPRRGTVKIATPHSLAKGTLERMYGKKDAQEFLDEHDKVAIVHYEVA